MAQAGTILGRSVRKEMASGMRWANMFSTFIRGTFRLLKRQRMYAAINLFGLALGLGATILILSFVYAEWSYDNNIPSREAIFRVDIQTINPEGEPEQWAGLPMPLAPALAAETDHVEAATRVLIRTIPAATDPVESVNSDVIFTDAAFFEVLAPFYSPLGAEWAPEELVVSRSMSEQLGVQQGDVVQLELNGTEKDYTILKVVDDQAANSSFQFDFLASIESYPAYEERNQSWTSWTTNAFVRLSPAVEVEKLASVLEQFAGRRLVDMERTWRILEWIRDDEYSFELALTPLADVHLMPEVQVVQTPVTDPSYLRTLLALGIALLLIACINFTTLSVGRATRRSREVGVRKVLGATRSGLVGQFLTEAVVLSGMAVVGAIILAEAFGPAFNTMVGAESVPGIISSWAAVPALGLLVLLAGLIAGAYPALFLSRFSADRAIADTIRASKRSRWMQGLVTLQFAASILFLVGVFAVSAQLRYMKQKDLGYSPDQIVVAEYSAPDAATSERFLARLRSEAASLPGVEGITASSTGLAGGVSWNSFTTSEGARFVYTNRIDPAFLEMMEMEIVRGRGFREDRPSDRTSAVVVNETFVEEFGWDEPIGEEVPWFSWENVEAVPEVIGVVKNFHFKTLHSTVEPMVFFLSPRTPSESFEYVYFKVAGDRTRETLAGLESVWKSLDPGAAFTYSFLEDALARRYAEDERARNTAAYASVFAILIACLGLLGLAAFTAERRKKEMGIRKVLGATAYRLSILMSTEFGILVFIANLIALPAAYLLIQRWLESYPYHIELRPGLFISAAAVSLVIAMIVVLTQVHRTSRRNPVDSLRTD